MKELKIESMLLPTLSTKAINHLLQGSGTLLDHLLSKLSQYAKINYISKAWQEIENKYDNKRSIE